MEILKEKEGIQFWIKSVFNDPIAKNLIKSGNLTKKQLETFLIDILSENFFDRRVTYDEKTAFRISRKKISRGSFNKTLRQAKKNIIRSIYTILLMGYLGILDNVSIEPYIEIANKLQEFKTKIASANPERKFNSKELWILNILTEQLESSIGKLSDVKSVSQKVM